MGICLRGGALPHQVDHHGLHHDLLLLSVGVLLLLNLAVDLDGRAQSQGDIKLTDILPQSRRVDGQSAI